MCIWIPWFLRCWCLLLPSPAWPRPVYLDSWTLYPKFLCSTVFELLLSVLLFLFREQSLVFLVWRVFWPYRILSGFVHWAVSVLMFPLLGRIVLLDIEYLVIGLFFFPSAFEEHCATFSGFRGFWWEICCLTSFSYVAEVSCFSNCFRDFVFTFQSLGIGLIDFVPFRAH